MLNDAIEHYGDGGQETDHLLCMATGADIITSVV